MPRIFIFLLSLLLTGCAGSAEDSSVDSEPTAPSSKLESLAQPAPACSEKEFDAGSAVIAKQLRAFSESEPDAAYAIASERFKSMYSVDDFANIILSQYTMLLNIKEFTFQSCTKEADIYYFVLELFDLQGIQYKVDYAVSVINGRWGIDGAAVSRTIN